MIDSDKKQKCGAYFPQAYLTDMFDFFQRNSDKIQIITYHDIFSDSDEYNYNEGYPTEKSQWLNSIKTNKIDASKAYVLLQYDIDS